MLALFVLQLIGHDGDFTDTNARLALDPILRQITTTHCECDNFLSKISGHNHSSVFDSPARNETYASLNQGMLFL